MANNIQQHHQSCCCHNYSYSYQYRPGHDAKLPRCTYPLSRAPTFLSSSASLTLTHSTTHHHMLDRRKEAKQSHVFECAREWMTLILDLIMLTSATAVIAPHGSQFITGMADNVETATTNNIHRTHHPPLRHFPLSLPFPLLLALLRSSIALMGALIN